MKHEPETDDSTSVNQRNPWPGLLAFREEDHPFFHGRAAEVEIVHRMVQRQRLTTVFGLSGLGKTSMLLAGLFPLWRKEHILPVYIRLDHSGLGPGLAEQVRLAVSRAAAEGGVDPPNPGAGCTLWEYFHRQDALFWNDRNRIVTPLLVFDQFEELFTVGKSTLASASRATFLQELADLIEGRAPTAVQASLNRDPREASLFAFRRHNYKVVLSLREDFLAELETLRGQIPSIALNRFRLSRMSGDKALEVIVGHGERLVDEEVALEVIRFVAGLAPGDEMPLDQIRVEPALLSVVMRELNNRRLARKERKITADVLARSRDEILAEFYRRSLEDMPVELSTFIEDRLLTPSGYRDSVALEVAQASPGVTEHDINQLVARRLLRIEDHGGLQRLELTHDVLTDVIRESRDRRLKREGEEQARKREESRQREAHAKLFKAYGVAATAILLLAGTLAFGLWGFYERNRARRALSKTAFQAGVRAVQDDRLPDALANFAEAVRQDAGNEPARVSILNLLMRETWAPLTKEPMEVSAIDYSSDGSWAVLALRGGRLEIWDQNASVVEKFDAEAEVQTVKIGPQPGQFVTTSGPVARIWSAKSGPIGQPLVHGNRSTIDGVAFSPDGRLIVTTEGERTGELVPRTPAESPATEGSEPTKFVVRLWDASTGSRVGRDLRHDSPVVLAGLTASGLVVTRSLDGIFTSWRPSSGTIVAQRKQSSSGRFAVLGPDGRYILTSGPSARLLIADTLEPDGEPAWHSVASASFNHDGSKVVSTSPEGTARVWNLTSGDKSRQVPQPLRLEGPVNSAHFNGDGTRIVTTRADGTVEVWDVDSRRRIAKLIAASSHGVGPIESGLVSARLNRNSTLIITESEDGRVAVWDARPRHAIARELTIPGEADFSSGHGRYLPAWRNGVLRIVDLETGEISGRHLPLSKKPVSAVVHGGATRLVTVGEDGSGVFWNLEADRSVGVRLAQEPIRFSEFNELGNRLMTVSEQSVRIWDARSGKPILGPTPHREQVVQPAWSPDGRFLTTAVTNASSDNLTTVSIWDANAGTRLGQWTLKHRMTAWRLVQNDSRLVIAGEEEAGVYEVLTGKKVETLDNLGKVRFLEFSREANLLLIGAEDSVRLWDAEAFEAVGEPMRHDGAILSAAFDAIGKYVVTASEGSARIWEADSGILLAEARQWDASLRWARLSADGKRLAMFSSDGSVSNYEIAGGTEEMAEALAAMAEASAGRKLNSNGAIVREGGLNERKDAILGLAIACRDPGLPAIATWLLSDPYGRKISPFSEVSLDDHFHHQLSVRRERKRMDRRMDLEKLFPGHPLFSREAAPEADSSGGNEISH